MKSNMPIFVEFEFFVFIITLSLMIYASIKDFQDRAIDGIVWLILLIFALPITFFRLIFYWEDWNLLLIGLLSIIIGLLLALLIGLLGMWGGADILALISLSIITPFSLYVFNNLNPVFGTTLLLQTFPLSLSIIMNASLLQIPIPLAIAFKNSINYIKNPLPYRNPNASRLKKVFASFIGEPKDVYSIIQKNPWFYQVLETTTDLNQPFNFPVQFMKYSSEPLFRWQIFRLSWWKIKTKRLPNLDSFLLLQRRIIWRFDFQLGLKSEEEELFRQRNTLLKAIHSPFERHYLWIQYSIPFLIPMTIGYIIAFFWGNILLEILIFLALF